MKQLVLRLSWLAVLAVGGACSSSSSSADPSGVTPPPPPAVETPPADVQPDGAPKGDAAPGDAGADVAGSGDIVGTLSGSCGQVTGQLTSASPSILRDLLVFTSSDVYDRAHLSSGGQRMYDTANAGGSSIESEVFSYEVLRYCETATLLKTETEISYAPPDDSGPNTITDLEVEIAGKKVGVSVTRAYKPPTIPLTDQDVQDLVTKKLVGINRSSQRVLPADKWVKQILHVFAVDKNAADAVERVWSMIDPATRADTIVLVTETTGGGFIYCNPDPPLGSECP